MKRIYLKAYTNLNFGDDLFIYILCKRYPEAHFYLACSRFVDMPFEEINNLTIMNRTHLKGFLIQNIKRLMNRLFIKTKYPFDAEVYIGGSIFIQPDDWKDNCSYEEQLYEYSISNGIPFFILGSNFGPYDDEKFLEIHKKFFERKITDICFRDLWSYNLFKEQKMVRYAPDIVCTYSMPKIKKDNLIVISCIHYDGREGLNYFDNEAYIQKMVEVVDYYVKIGKKICLVSLCKDQGDEISCYEIKKRSQHSMEIVCYNGDVDEIILQFSKAEYVIASRFHAMVLGWLANVPVYPISYNNKTEEVIKSYGFMGAYSKIKEFCGLDCKLIDINRNRNYIFDIEECRNKSQDQFSKLDAFLEKNREGRESKND